MKANNGGWSLNGITVPTGTGIGTIYDNNLSYALTRNYDIGDVRAERGWVVHLSERDLLNAPYVQLVHSQKKVPTGPFSLYSLVNDNPFINTGSAIPGSNTYITYDTYNMKNSANMTPSQVLRAIGRLTCKWKYAPLIPNILAFEYETNWFTGILEGYFDNAEEIEFALFGSAPYKYAHIETGHEVLFPNRAYRLGNINIRGFYLVGYSYRQDTKTLALLLIDFRTGKPCATTIPVAAPHPDRTDLGQRILYGIHKRINDVFHLIPKVVRRRTI